MRTTIRSCSELDINSIVAADNATWTAFFTKSCPGFIRKVSLVQKEGAACYMWT
jgi:hypothetical protein